jgi:hypothetical protein
MQTLVKKSHAETGDLEVNKFKGRLNAKAFRLLTDNIYSDKIKALIRELSTNALDSQKEAGYAGGFDVHLPTILQPYFYLRDYGVGMSPEMVVDTYTVFFESTKDQSNDFTGCLGLGSKTPLHYHTKSCTVTSYKDGMMYVYSCFMGNDGCPAYTKLNESETSEPNGVKVEFPVNKYDIESFYDRASEVYKWFSIKPVFTGKSVDIPTPSYCMDTPEWKLNNHRNSGVLMGNILYPIEQFKAKELDKYNSLINAGIIIIAEIGDVEFDMSREHLSYSPMTVRYLVGKFEKIKAEYAATLQEHIDKCDSYYGAQQKFAELSNRLTNIFGVKSTDLSFNGEQLKTNIDFDSLTANMYCKNSHRKSISPAGFSYSKYFPVNQNLKVFVNDLKVGCLSRIKRHIEALSLDNYNILLYKDLTTAKAELKCLESDVILASSLPAPVYTGRASYSRGSIGIWPVYHSNSMVSKCWKDNSIDIDKDKGLYVIRTGYKIKINGQEYHPTEIDSLLEFNRIFDPSVTPIIIGCAPSNEAKLVKAGWKSLESQVNENKKKDKYKEIYINQKFKLKANNLFEKSLQSKYGDHYITNNLSTILKIDSTASPDIKELKELHSNISSQVKDNTNYRFNIDEFTDEINEKINQFQKEIDKLDSVLNNIKVKYPLLNSVSLYYISAKMIEPYIIGVNHVSSKD